MKKLLVPALGAFALIVTATASFAESVETKAKVALFYADWCGACQVLDPKVEAVKADYMAKGVEFVKLDFTDKSKKDVAWPTADEHGLSNVYAKYKKKTGFAIITDANGEKIGKIRMGDSDKVIRAKLDKAVM